MNSRVRAVYNNGEEKLVSLRIDGEDVDPAKLYTICLQNYHAKNSKAYLNLSQEELRHQDKGSYHIILRGP